MNEINQYSVYQSGYTQSAYAKSGIAHETESANKKADSVKERQDTYEKGIYGSRNEVKLSEKAQKLLEELKKKYGNMEFRVANYSSREEAARYLSGSVKEYSVLIEPETLEEMAADESVKEKYMNVLDNSAGTFEELKSRLGDKADSVNSFGVSIDKDGNVSFFAELEKMSQRQKEYQEKALEGRREAAKKEEAANKKAQQAKQEEAKRTQRGVTRVYADSIDELIEKIKETDLTDGEENSYTSGSYINYSV